MTTLTENFWIRKQDRPILAIYIMITLIIGAIIIWVLLEYRNVIASPGWIPWDFGAYKSNALCT